MSSHQQRFAKGETIVKEGTPGDRSYVIKAGNVLVCKEGFPGQMVPLDELGPGDMFGEMYLLSDSGMRSASVIAVNEVVVEVLFEELMVADIDKMSKAQKMMFQGMTDRLSRTNDKLVKQRMLNQQLEAQRKGIPSAAPGNNNDTPQSSGGTRINGGSTVSARHDDTESKN